MESSPIEDAVAEQERAKAIHNRARAKLRAARDPEEQQRKTSPWVSKSVPGFRFVLLLVLCVGMPLWTVVMLPETVNPAIWSTDPRFLISIAISVAFIMYALVALRRRRRTPVIERVVRDFYKAAGSETGESANWLSEFVILADLDGAERPPPAFNPDGYRPALIDAKTVDRYWTYLSKPSWTLRYMFNVEDVSTSQIEPDLRLAQVKVRAVPMRQRLYFYWIFLPAMAVLWSAYEFATLDSWTMIGLLSGWALLCFAYDRWRKRRGDVYRVRKLLVRCGRDWRFFCADWQGYEERDLSWLDGDDTT